MQLVRPLALLAAVCGACATAQDNNSPSPPAATPSTGPPPPSTPSTGPPPPSAPPAGPRPPGPPPTGASGSLASTEAASKTDDPDGFTRVQINPQAPNAEVRMGFETMVINASTSTGFKTPAVDKMRVLVSPGTTSLELLSLESSKLHTLEIASYEGKPTTTISLTGNGFSNLSALTALTFQNIKFNKIPVTLPVPETLAYLKVDRCNVSDLALSTDSDIINLNEVAFPDVQFAALPFFLYQRLYPKIIRVTGNISITDGFTQLSGQEYANAMHNLGTAVASFIVFKPSCDGVTDTAADTRHVVCNDAKRQGVRKFGQNNINLDPSGTPSPPPPPPRSSNSNTTLTVIVIVIAVIAAVLAFFVARRYFCTSPSHSSSPRMNERTVGLISKDDSHNGTSAANPNKLSFISSDEALRQIRLEQQDVSVTKSVGTGRLWIGDYSGRKVMIKRIEAESSDSYATKALITQARSLAPLSHPNIVSLVGVTWVQGTDFGVVGEFMEKGTLRSVLMDLDSELDLQTKLHMCLDVALALKHLHTTDMYMRRLTSRKVLVNSALDCKLNLFECHPATNKIEYPEVFGAGEMAWEAPELITRTGILDPRKINIFSLGVLIGEIMTRVSPYQSAVDAVGNTLADLELVKRIRRQERLMPHENRREFTELPAALRDVVERCLSYQPLTRPSADEVILCLESVKEYSERFGSTTSL